MNSSAIREKFGGDYIAEVEKQQGLESCQKSQQETIGSWGRPLDY